MDYDSGLVEILNHFFHMFKTILITIFSLLCISARADGINRETVAEFELERYLGQWYEVARFDTSFERDLIKVTADYSLNDDGTITVVNRGYNTRKGEWGEASGRVKTTDEAGRLRVSFFPLVFTDYNVLALGENYEWALVGSTSADHLWILSRKPGMERHKLDSIIEIAEMRGYDVSKLNIL